MEAGLQQTPSADRIHIAFFGRRNAGKSSLVNAITNQTMSIVSEIQGTTTDPFARQWNCSRWGLSSSLTRRG